jgi:hypothetical protein
MNVRYAVDFDEIRGKGEVYTKIQKLIESRAIKTSRLKTGTDDKGKGKGKRKATAIEPPHSINPWKFILLEMMMYPRGQARVDLSLE